MTGASNAIAAGGRCQRDGRGNRRPAAGRAGRQCCYHSCGQRPEPRCASAGKGSQSHQDSQPRHAMLVVYQHSRNPHRPPQSILPAASAHSSTHKCKSPPAHRSLYTLPSGMAGRVSGFGSSGGGSRSTCCSSSGERPPPGDWQKLLGLHIIAWTVAIDLCTHNPYLTQRECAPAMRRGWTTPAALRRPGAAVLPPQVRVGTCQYSCMRSLLGFQQQSCQGAARSHCHRTQSGT